MFSKKHTITQFVGFQKKKRDRNNMYVNVFVCPLWIFISHVSCEKISENSIIKLKQHFYFILVVNTRTDTVFIKVLESNSYF